VLLLFSGRDRSGRLENAQEDPGRLSVESKKLRVRD
jgi:hypothetical protein